MQMVFVSGRRMSVCSVTSSFRVHGLLERALLAVKLLTGHLSMNDRFWEKSLTC